MKKKQSNYLNAAKETTKMYWFIKQILQYVPI